MDLRATAMSYLAAGLNPLPASPKTKYTKLKRWKSYQSRRMTARQVEVHFSDTEGVCLICGAISGGLEMIDFDQQGRAYEPWATLVEAKHPGLLAIMPRERTQGGGLHVYYRCERADENTTLARTAEGKKLIETRGERGLVVCAPTPGYVLENGRLEDVPLIEEDERQSLLGIASSLNQHVEPVRPVTVSVIKNFRTPRPGEPTPHERAFKYLLECPPAIQGCNGSAACMWAARVVVWGYLITNPEEALSVLKQEWNGRCQPPWSDRELLHKIHDADTKPFDKPRGWLLYAEWEAEGVDLGGVDLSQFAFGANGTAPAATSEEAEGEEDDDDDGIDPGAFPSHLFDVPGFIEQVVAYNLTTAHRKQPVLALGGAICLQAALAGRKIRDDRNNRTNVYVVSVSGSGTGKDWPRTVNSQALLQSGADRFEGPEDVASDAGLIAVLAKSPNLLLQIDEFGKFLRVLGNPSKAPHLYAILSVLLKLYSSAGKIFMGKAYADTERNQKINQPNLVLHASGVPSDFFESLTPESLQDGLVGRMLVFEGKPDAGRERQPDKEIPDEIKAVCRTWRDWRHGDGNLSDENPSPLVVPQDEHAHAVFDELGRRMDEKMRLDQGWEQGVWSRTEEKACRLALIYAASRSEGNPAQLFIDADAATWACDLAEYLARRLICLGRAHVSDNKFDAMQKKVLDKIARHGGGMTGRQYTLAFRHWDRDTRQKVLANLLETHQLFKRGYESSTKNGVEYVMKSAASTEPGSFVKNPKTRRDKQKSTK